MRSWNVYKLTHYHDKRGIPLAKRTYTGSVLAATGDEARALIAARWPHLATRDWWYCEITCEPWLTGGAA